MWVGSQKVLLSPRGEIADGVTCVAQNWYLGDDRSMLIPNTLFRMGGAAMVLTNRMSERWRAKYELQHVVRVHLGADDTAYECVPSLYVDKDLLSVLHFPPANERLWLFPLVHASLLSHFWLCSVQPHR